MRRFVDTNVFVYSAMDHPKFGETAKGILQRIEHGEEAVTSTLVLCEVSWVLEAVGRQGDIKPTLEKILSFRALQVLDFDADDLLVGASNMETYGIDFNDGVNVSMMTEAGISEVYSNDEKHLGKIDFLKLIFE
ncbi:MAG: type II toxin-antitoxin system VapC family toxin [Candidatus Geothermarchaeales archaeon]